MSIMEKLFGSAPARAQQPAPNQQQMQQQPAQTQPGNIPADAVNNLQSAATPQTAPNGAIPDTPETKAAAGMEQFKDMFVNAPPDPNNPNGQPLFNVSQEKMLEAARKQNFAGTITPEVLTKLGMSADAGPALAELLNTVSQNSYAQSAFATTKLIEGALEKGGYARSSDIDTKVKALSLNDSVRSENQLLNHAAAQPMVQLVQNQLLSKYPNASASELKDMAMKYLNEFANVINAPSQQVQQQQKAQTAQGEDWGKFLGMQ